MDSQFQTDTFRTAMSRLGAAVSIVTTDGPAGRHGLTVSAVSSVTDAPPTLLVCVNRSAGAHDVLRANGVLCVNVLAGRHEALSGRFGRRGLPVEERFGDGEWRRMATGAPVLTDAAVGIDCRISRVVEVGTHSVLFCEVVDVALDPEVGGLIYFDRAYHHLNGVRMAG